MSQVNCGSSVPASGKRLSSWRCAQTVTAAGSIAIVLTATVSDQPVAAQASAPAVSVVRDTAIDSRVWPSDVNRDGITDLISTSPFICGGGTCRGRNIQVSLGRGDGTFNSPVESASPGSVLGAADFNGDGKPDVISTVPERTGKFTIMLLPGTGTATVGSPVLVTTFSPDEFVFAA